MTGLDSSKKKQINPFVSPFGDQDSIETALDRVEEPSSQEMLRLMSSSVMSSFPPYMHEIKAKQIDAIIDLQKDAQQKEYDDRQQGRHYSFKYLVATFAFLLILFGSFLYTGNYDLVFKFIEWLVLIGVGFLGGMGFNEYRTRNK